MKLRPAHPRRFSITGSALSVNSKRVAHRQVQRWPRLIWSRPEKRQWMAIAFRSLRDRVALRFVDPRPGFAISRSPHAASPAMRHSEKTLLTTPVLHAGHKSLFLQ